MKFLDKDAVQISQQRTLFRVTEIDRRKDKDDWYDDDEEWKPIHYPGGTAYIFPLL